MNESGDRTDAAKKLHEAGKWVYTKLDSVRTQLQARDLLQFNRATTLRMVVAFLNRTDRVLSTSDSTGESSPGTPVSVQTFLDRKFVDNVLGTPLDADSILTASVDGARFPISFVSEGGENRRSDDTRPDDEVLSRFIGSIILGQYYDCIERLWLEFLWHGWEILEKATYSLVLPVQDSLAANRAISDYRRESLLFEATLHVINGWRLHLTVDQKEDLSRRPIITIEGSGDGRQYMVRYKTIEDDLPSLSVLHQAIAREEYYENILESPLPRVGNISLRQLLDAWEVLRALGEAQELHLPTDTGVTTVEGLVQFAPVITRAELANLFCSALRVSSEVANRLIDFFTFTPSPRNELWDAPLVLIESDRYALVLSVVLHTNLLRTLERFMVRGGLDISRKGPEFEVECRRRIKDVIQRSRTLKNAGIHRDHVTLCEGEEEEEIDLLLWIGDTFLVTEAKCLLFPSEPMDFRHYYDTLEEAAHQAERKARFADKHRAKLVELLDIPREPSTLVIKPLVIVNSSFGVGFTCCGVPVTDLHILGVFLRQGFVEHLVVFGPDGKKESVGSTTRFYACEKTAAEAIYPYLCNPPQLEAYKKSLHVDLRPAPKLSAGDKPFVVGRYEVRMVQPFP